MTGSSFHSSTMGKLTGLCVSLVCIRLNSTLKEWPRVVRPYYFPLRRYPRYHWVSSATRVSALCILTPFLLSTLYSMAKFAGLRDPVTLDFENSTIAYCVDAFSISMGALMGVPPVTAYIESATGISGTFPYLTFRRYIKCLRNRGWQDWNYSYDGWICLLHLGLLCPYLCVHPTLGYWWCPGHCWLAYDSEVSSLVVTSFRNGTDCMYSSVREINWDYMGDAVPAFLTIIIIPLTYKSVFFPFHSSAVI
jgi:hypothetical protein